MTSGVQLHRRRRHSRSPVGERVNVAPAVHARDRYGNGVSDVAVAYRVTLGDGSVSAAVARSDTAGLAALAHWTLGSRSGQNAVTASTTNASDVVFVATGRAGAVSRIDMIAGDLQSATVGNVGAIAPTIQLRDAFGNPVPGHSVQFVIGSGGGSAVGSSVKSDENGMAVGRWTLGTSVGTNTLKAAVAGLAPITFSATGKADTPALYRFVDGRGQIEVVSTSLPVVPRVRVLDRFGNRIAGVAVSFSVAAGGGSINLSTGATNAEGEITPGSWRLGPTEGFNVLRANSQGFIQIGLVARAVPPSAFPIEVR